MPGRTAKVTITERQQDILQTIRNAPTASSQLRQRATIVLLAFERRGNPRSPPKSDCRGGRSASGDDAGPTPGIGSSGSSAPRATPRCAGPSSRSSAMSPAPAPPASSLPSRSWRSWPSPASPRRSPAGPSLTGRPTSWPMRSSSGASCRRSRWPRWGAISARPPCSPTRSGIGSTPPRRTRCDFRSRSRRSVTPTWRRPRWRRTTGRTRSAPMR